MDAMEQDLRSLGIRAWKNITLDRSRWRGVVKAVKAPETGCGTAKVVRLRIMRGALFGGKAAGA
jgi:hypothetical protein